MPPEEEPRPDEAELGAWIGGLEGLLDEVVASGSADRTSPLRRMNRFEYGNAVRDLFELDVNLFSLPEAMVRPHGDYFQPASGVMPDRVKVGNRSLGKSQLIEKRLHGVNPFPRDLRAEHGYNNRGDHLSLSPILMESFLALGQSIVQANNLPEHCGIWDRFFAAPGGAPEEERAIASLSFATHLDPVAAAELADLPKDTPLVFQCHHGGRSLQAAQHYKGLGFTKVWNLTGGIDAWSRQVDGDVPRY